MRTALAVLMLGLLPCLAMATDKMVADKDVKIVQDPARSIRKLCRELVAYQPDPSADVDYVPGKDVRGKAVVPANLDGADQNIDLQYPLQIAITLDQAKQFNLSPDTENTYTPRMFVGMIELHKDGSVYFDGKRLTQPQVQFLCTEN